MIKIGQASIDENGRITGGTAGNQTGKELNIRNYYKGNWTALLRCKDSVKALFMANECIKACNNPCIGYDQSQRNTLRTQARAYGYDLGAIKTPCECDCSSLIAVIAECVGINVYSSANAPTTATMVTAFVNTGYFDVLTDSKYLTTDTYLKAGDILVKNGHTVMVLGNGSGSVISTSGYTVGNTYTTNVDLNVRDSADGQKLKYDALTQDGKAHAKYDAYGNAILLANTRVTCKEVKTMPDGRIWIRIPSGWICAKTTEKTYIL